jgi:hypothetical protein
VILSLQVGRFLIKSVREIQAKQVNTSLSVLYPISDSVVLSLSLSFALLFSLTLTLTLTLLSLTLTHFLSSPQEPKGSVQYLLDAPLGKVVLPTGGWRGQGDLLLALLKDRAARTAFKLEARFTAAQNAGKSFDEATNAVAILSYKAAQCHSSFVACRNNLEAVKEFVTDAKCKAVSMRLLELNSLILIKEAGVDFMPNLDEEHFGNACC